MQSRGVLYIATSEKYRREAVKSVRKLKQETDIPVTLVTNKKVEAEEFDHIIIDESAQQSFLDKPRNLMKSPYEETLFLDTDVYVLGEIEPLFDLLTEFELAVSVDHHEGKLVDTDNSDFPEVPMAFPEFNTGVLAYKTSDSVEKFMSTWISKFNTEQPGNQISFRAALWESNIEFAPISKRFNALSGVSVYGSIQLFHDNSRVSSILSDEEWDKLLHDLNSSTDQRVLFHGNLSFIPIRPRRLPLVFKLGILLTRYSFREMTRAIKKKLSLFTHG
jgi:hypothetical protein